jgi:hypothetical protein
LFIGGYVGVDAMELPEIDPFLAQPLEAAVQLLAQVFGAAVHRPLVRSRALVPCLRRDDEPLGIGVQRLGDQLLGDVRPVGVGGIDEVDSQVDRPPKDTNRLAAIRWRTPHSFSSDPHGAEAHAIDGEITAESDGACGRCRAVGGRRRSRGVHDVSTGSIAVPSGIGAARRVPYFVSPIEPVIPKRHIRAFNVRRGE